MADGVEHIYLALGYTDFRKQINGLSSMVALQFKLDPYAGKSLFLFCNKRRTAIKALRWDGNGFVLASKNLVEHMKFQWPKTKGDLRNINKQELRWLLEGLQIDQKKAHAKNVDTSGTVF
ncbi:IS66 family insertion sequence element accessory protein TnpB [Crassaminicella profunda]|uniref:IS66 family insertion sequence element accessory protein TnpB n=1 Tax=Crassaminicella profunda TaxID=1286698 RepID=UPI001CA6B5F7|nr:IS66 family insertion sequence element accessory protein TnpB [Crassaminicella profunda]QZY57178.1 IS66 family insertion sequence element accessory protein TnpB [Crassaminicella profunda]